MTRPVVQLHADSAASTHVSGVQHDTPYQQQWLGSGVSPAMQGKLPASGSDHPLLLNHSGPPEFS